MTVAVISWHMESRFVKNGAGLLRNNYRKDKKMYLIAGLGNPTREYEKTRHNVGFSVIDVLADKYNIDVSDRKHKALLKPQTFMNLSGESIREAVDYYKIDPEDIIVIYDDISLEPGQLRIRLKGSAGGHNGIKNIIAHLGTQEFPRIKVGVGAKPPKMDLADYVLSRFGAEEQKVMDEAFGEAAEAAVMMMTTGAERAMNHYNAKKKAE